MEANQLIAQPRIERGQPRLQRCQLHRRPEGAAPRIDPNPPQLYGMMPSNCGGMRREANMSSRVTFSRNDSQCEHITKLRDVALES